MQSKRAIHSRTFRMIYCSPKQGDVFGCVQICIHSIYLTIFICAFKNPVSSLANIFTTMASLRSVTRVNSYQSNSIKQRFVSHKRTQLRKIPSTKFCPKSFIFVKQGSTKSVGVFLPYLKRIGVSFALLR